MQKMCTAHRMEEDMSRYIGVQMLEFAQKGDERGHLVIVEGMKKLNGYFIFTVQGKMSCAGSMQTGNQNLS